MPTPAFTAPPRFRNQWTAICLWAVVALAALPGCTLSLLKTTPPEDGMFLFTAAAQTSTVAARTLEAELTRLAGEATASPNPQATRPAGTPLPLLSPTPLPGQPTSPPGGKCNQGAFVADVTIPDGQTFGPGAPFGKTWRLKNTGSCPWTAGYSIVFAEGDAMGGPAASQLTSGAVAPGQEVDISLDLVAPAQPGTYRGDWKLRDAAGQVFGLGENGKASFWVIVEVTGAPEVSFSYETTHDCTGIPHAIFRLANTGAIDLESGQITLTNLTSNTPLYGPLAHNGPFMGRASECPQGASALEAGKTGFMGGSLGTTPSGQTIRADFKVCSQDNLSGACTEASLTFPVP